ncbi:hypothetical protein AB0G05_05940 [Nonomuraea wenchangensis]
MAASGSVLLVRGQADYVALIAPVWLPILGAIAAAVTAWLDRGRQVVGSLTMVLLLPSVVALIFHLLRVIGAIPLPVDWWATVSSTVAAATVWCTWQVSRPLTRPDGSSLNTPRWVAVAAVAAALAYPALKTSWALGARWLAPRGTPSGIDANYLFPVALTLVGITAILISLRWWNTAAPRWARPAAATGALVLVGLGLSGLSATFHMTPPEGPALGVVVYGSWLLWGLLTLTIAGRLSPARTGEPSEAPRSPMPSGTHAASSPLVHGQVAKNFDLTEGCVHGSGARVRPGRRRGAVK